MKKLLIIFFFYTFTFAASSHSFWDTYTAELRGDKVAQFRTAVIFEQGIGMESNQSQAAKWYEKAAIQGHMDAQYHLGLMYASGRGVEQNDQFAMMWLASAAKQGDREARKLLNEIIDNKYETKEKVSSEYQSSNGAMIKPVRFDIKEGGKICSKPNLQSQCHLVGKTKISYTSNREENGFYKLTGIVSPGKGWKDYIGEGWIEEGSVDIRR